ncbi:MAG: DUF1786 family protein [Dehalococcoidia bacterium]|nr:DUF1786 family protein [Dehalococcoidia bacterium]
MRILAVDVGTGTQDILLFDSSSLVENCVKMVMPSPTRLVAECIAAATRQGRPILLEGVTMGGGPSKKALSRHTAAGLAAYATEEAALTFHDDLEVVKSMGVTVLSRDEVGPHDKCEVIRLADLDLTAIMGALQSFGADSRFDAVAVAVLDHGFAPKGVSNRLFRFQCLQQLMEKNSSLSAFAHLAAELPDQLTRMKAVAKSVNADVPVLLMDTGAAAALGALQDPAVSRHNPVLAINMGNSHAVAFHLDGLQIKGFFEHHTNLLDAKKVDDLAEKLARGVLAHEEVFEGGGHGAIVISPSDSQPFLAVTGPRRDVLSGTSLRFHAAVPHGDTMLTGCYGLVKAFGLRMESWREEIDGALAADF